MNMGGAGQEEAPAAPGTWAARKEARRNMYLTSTDRVRVQRRGVGASKSSSGNAAAAACQKCLRPGHWTYECKNEAVYVKRASRTVQLKNPKKRQGFNQDKPPEDVEREAAEESKRKNEAKLAKKRKRGLVVSGKDAKAKKKSKSKRKHSTRKKRRDDSSDSSDSGSDSSSSSSSSGGSESDSDSGSSSGSSSSGASSSSGSGSDSDSDSSTNSSSSDGSRSRNRRHRPSVKRRRKDE